MSYASILRSFLRLCASGTIFAEQGDDAREDESFRLDEIRNDTLRKLVNAVRQASDPSYNSRQHGLLQTRFNIEEGCYMYCIAFKDNREWEVRFPWVNFYYMDTVHSFSISREVATLSWLREHTTIPLVRIFDVGENTNNSIRLPYIMHERYPGTTLGQLWYDDREDISEEEKHRRRCRALDGIAKAMVQLSRFRFRKGGCVNIGNGIFQGIVDKMCLVRGGDCSLGAHDFEERARRIHGTSRPWEQFPFADDLDDETVEVDKSQLQGLAPTRTTDEFYQLYLPYYRQTADTPVYIGCVKLMFQFLNWLQSMENIKQPFVLSMMDMNPSQFIVSEDGELVSLSVTAELRAMPRTIGPKRFPNWLVADWDPGLYDDETRVGLDLEVAGPEAYAIHLRQTQPFWSYFAREEPRTLARYRQIYQESIARYSQQLPTERAVPPYDDTKISLITTSLFTAMRWKGCREGIMRKLLEEMEWEDKPEPLPLEKWYLRMADNELDEKTLSKLEEGFRGLFKKLNDDEGTSHGPAGKNDSECLVPEKLDRVSEDCWIVRDRPKQGAN